MTEVAKPTDQVEEQTSVVNPQVVTSIDDFANHIDIWHRQLYMRLSAIIDSESVIKFQEDDGTEKIATPEQAYGFKRGIIHALECFQLPFDVQVVEDPVLEDTADYQIESTAGN